MNVNLGAKLLLNWAAVGVSVLLSIALYRLQLHVLGPTVLGTWVTLSAVCGYLAILELGLGAAINKYLAGHHAVGDQESEGALLSTALFLYSLLAIAALGLGLLLIALSGPLLHLDRLEPGLAARARGAMLLLSINVAASFVLCVYRGVIFGRGRTDVVAVITIARHGLYAGLVLLCLRRGGDLRGLAIAGLLADVSAGLCLWIFARLRLRSPRIPLRLPRRDILRALFSYCGAVVLITIGLQLLRGTTLPLLQRALGPEVVARYAPAERLGTLFVTLVGQMGVVMVPPVAAACAMRPASVGTTLVQTGRLGIFLGLPPLLMLLGVGDFILSLWLGPDMAASALYLRIYGLALFAQLISFGTDIGAYAVGGRRAYGIAKLTMGLGAVGLIQVGIHHAGAAGAAAGAATAVTLCDAILTPVLVCRALGFSHWSYYVGLARRGGRVVLFLGLVLVLVRLCRPDSFVSLFVLTGFGASLGWLLAYFTYLEDADRALLRSRIQPARAAATTAVPPVRCDGVLAMPPPPPSPPSAPQEQL